MQKIKRASASLLIVLLLTGCPGGPVVDVCISSGDVSHGMDCVDKKEKPYTKKYELTKNHVCFLPEDFKAVVDYCKLGQEK